MIGVSLILLAQEFRDGLALHAHAISYLPNFSLRYLGNELGNFTEWRYDRRVEVELAFSVEPRRYLFTI